MNEVSIDLGGPRREFFRFLSLQASECLLRGDQKRFFANNVCAIQVNAY